MIGLLAISLRSSRVAAPLVGVLSILACIPLTGCAIAGFLMTLAPPEDIEAKYEFPAEATVLVLVDDPANLVDYAPIKYELTRRINEQLDKRELVDKTIAYSRLMQRVASSPEYSTMSIASIGEKLGAQQVLYVRITDFQLKNEKTTTVWHGRLGATVRVIDVKKGRLWPKDLVEGYPVDGVETPMQQSGPFSQFGLKLSRQMAEEMADNIVKLFYKHPGRPHDELPPSEPSVEP